MPGDRALNMAIVESAPDDCRVQALYRALLKLRRQALMGNIVLGDDEQSARKAIEAMDDSWSEHPVDAGQVPTMMHEGVDEGVRPHSRSRVHGHACRFVDDEQIAVFKDDLEGDILGLDREGQRLGDADVDAVARPNLVAGTLDPSSDAYRSILNERLNAAARQTRAIGSEQPIEPVAARHPPKRRREREAGEVKRGQVPSGSSWFRE